MKLIKPYTEILTDIDSTRILKDIEKAARVCYKSEDKITEDDSSARKIAGLLIASGHEAMLEFGDIAIKFVCDRAIAQEVNRHRIASYAMESTRYCNYAKGKFNSELTFILPPWVNQHDTDPKMDGPSDSALWIAALEEAEMFYMKLINKGWTAQQARTVLPLATKTELVFKTNVREWRYFLNLRSKLDVHPQLRELVIPLLSELKEKIPVLFDDINVN